MTAPILTADAAPGSMRAHENLAACNSLWTLADQAFKADPSDANNGMKVAAMFHLIHAAELCGMPLSVPSVRAWAARRVATYHASLGVGEI